MDSAQQWRQGLHNIANGRSRVCFARRGAGIPGRDLGLHAVDRGGVGLGQTLVHAGFDHLELQEAFRAAQGLDHGLVCFGSLLDTLCFTLLAVVYDR